jgi:hypothetical protein
MNLTLNNDELIFKIWNAFKQFVVRFWMLLCRFVLNYFDLVYFSCCGVVSDDYTLDCTLDF